MQNDLSRVGDGWEVAVLVGGGNASKERLSANMLREGDPKRISCRCIIKSRKFDEYKWWAQGLRIPQAWILSSETATTGGTPANVESNRCRFGFGPPLLPPDKAKMQFIASCQSLLVYHVLLLGEHLVSCCQAGPQRSVVRVQSSSS